MIDLVRTDRKPNFTGVTPAFVVGATLFFAAILTGHFFGKHHHLDLTPCLFKIVTDLPCFLCGGTRASLALAKANPLTALKFNPLVTTVLCYIIVALLLKFVFARKLILTGPFRDRRFQWMIAITFILANWIYIIRTL